MKDCWVLSVKTSLPETAQRFDRLKTSISVFDSFEKARDAMRSCIKGYAFSENQMFDGKGRLKRLEEYIERRCEEGDIEDGEEGELNKGVLSEISRALAEAFSGADTVLRLKDGYYTDWMVSMEVKEGRLQFSGDDDGPCNGYDPVLATNIFSMEKDREYYLYIEDLFGQNRYPAVLYIDLRWCCLNEKMEGMDLSELAFAQAVRDTLSSFIPDDEFDTTGEKDEEDDGEDDEPGLAEQNLRYYKTVKFGPYEWLVLNEEDYPGTLLIAKEGISSRPYHEVYGNVTWEDCSLRKWLNREFLNCFTDEERARILKTDVKNNDNPRYGTLGGNDTEDQVFLLSLEEAFVYFAADKRRICIPGKDAVEEGVDIENDACPWWLRSPGKYPDSATLILANGSLDADGECVDAAGSVENYDNSDEDWWYGGYAVRPAMWVNLES